MAPHSSTLGRRSLVGCSPWGREESDMTERLHFHFSLACIGEGNGNPLQGSCLENPRDGGAWWAAVYGVAQSRTRLKRLSSSSSIPETNTTFLISCTPIKKTKYLLSHPCHRHCELDKAYTVTSVWWMKRPELLAVRMRRVYRDRESTLISSGNTDFCSGERMRPGLRGPS